MYEAAFKRVKQLKPWVVRNPKDKLFYGIDRVLRCPVTVGFKQKVKAEKAWFAFMATYVCDMSAMRKNNLYL